jgi:acyl carrier protein
MLFDKMTLDDYNAVCQPKFRGSWNLHKELPKDMDFFIMLSSISGIIGNATQAAYAAGSAFMDSFAMYRNSLGLPAVTLDLGVITGVGYLAQNRELAAGMERQGFEGTNEEKLMALIQSAIAEPRKEGSLAQTVTGLGTYKEGVSLGSFDVPLFAQFRRQTVKADDANEEGATQQIRDTLKRCKTLDEATSKIYQVLVNKIASRLGVPIENIRSEKSMSEYGTDSLVAVELRNWIAKEMESAVPILELLANNSLLQLATKIAQRSKLVSITERE